VSDGNRAHHRRHRGRTGPVVGWRAWRVVRERGTFRLRSAVYEQAWPLGRELEATCARGHAAPSPDCECGIYAVRAPAEALRYLVGRNDPEVVHRVVGQVALSGVVVEGQHGWRASRAYPLRICIPPRQTSGFAVESGRLARALSVYGAVVETLGEHEPRAIELELMAA
jgi:hypothetical protein